MVCKSQQAYHERLGLHSDLVYTLQYISWNFPPEGWVKLNCDGSVNQHKRASCGGFMHDVASFFFFFWRGFAMNLGSCPIMVAKVWGAYYVLLMACQEGYKHVILELYSTAAITLIQKGTNRKHPYSLV